MGNGISTFTSDKLVMFEIQNTIKELIKNYSIWTDPEKCNKMELVYKNKLLNFSDSQLYQISLLLGYKYDKPIPRDKICDLIVGHYKKRIELLKKINSAVDQGADMVTKAREGDYCKNTTKNIGDFFTCSAIPKAMWIDKNQFNKIIEDLRKTGRLGTMMKWIAELEKYYYSSLYKLLRIIENIKIDIDNTVSFAEFEVIETETNNIIKDMLDMCQIYYLLAINSK